MNFFKKILGMENTHNTVENNSAEFNCLDLLSYDPKGREVELKVTSEKVEGSDVAVDKIEVTKVGCEHFNKSDFESYEEAVEYFNHMVDCSHN
jgi:hypothetical protein